MNLHVEGLAIEKQSTKPAKNRVHLATHAIEEYPAVLALDNQIGSGRHHSESEGENLDPEFFGNRVRTVPRAVNRIEEHRAWTPGFGVSGDLIPGTSRPLVFSAVFEAQQAEIIGHQTEILRIVDQNTQEEHHAEGEEIVFRPEGGKDPIGHMRQMHTADSLNPVHRRLLESKRFGGQDNISTPTLLLLPRIHPRYRFEDPEAAGILGPLQPHPILGTRLRKHPSRIEQVPFNSPKTF